MNHAKLVFMLIAIENGNHDTHSHSGKILANEPVQSTVNHVHACVYSCATYGTHTASLLCLLHC